MCLKNVAMAMDTKPGSNRSILSCDLDLRSLTDAISCLRVEEGSAALGRCNAGSSQSIVSFMGDRSASFVTFNVGSSRSLISCLENGSVACGYNAGSSRSMISVMESDDAVTEFDEDTSFALFDIRQVSSRSWEANYGAGSSTIRRIIENSDRQPSSNEFTGATISFDSGEGESVSNTRSRSRPPRRVSDDITEPTNEDILYGRGGRINNHPGNIYFRDVAHQYQSSIYHESLSKKEKRNISFNFVERMKREGRRFLEKKEDGKWHEVEDKGARLKASQALREKKKTRHY